MDNYTTQFIEDDNPIGESLLTNQLNGMTEGILNNAQLTELPKHPLIASSKSDHPWIHSAWDPIAHHDLMRSWSIAVLAGSEIENRECWLGNFIRIFHRGRARGSLPVGGAELDGAELDLDGAELDPADRPIAAELDPADRPIAAAG